MAARVLQVVDVYDALTTVRPYKKALPQAKALEIMEDEVKRGWWDPVVFTAFTEMVGREVVAEPEPRLLTRAAAAAAGD